MSFLLSLLLQCNLNFYLLLCRSAMTLNSGRISKRRVCWHLTSSSHALDEGMSSRLRQYDPTFPLVCGQRSNHPVQQERTIRVTGQISLSSHRLGLHSSSSNYWHRWDSQRGLGRPFLLMRTGRSVTVRLQVCLLELVEEGMYVVDAKCIVKVYVLRQCK